MWCSQFKKSNVVQCCLSVNPYEILKMILTTVMTNMVVNKSTNKAKPDIPFDFYHDINIKENEKASHDTLTRAALSRLLLTMDS